jgi:hypothetical protein
MAANKGMRTLTYRTSILLGVFVTLVATAVRAHAANDAGETHALEPTALVGIAVMLLPAAGFSQEPGSNPDVPLNGQGVPFDSNMNIILLIVGGIFAIYKQQKTQTKKLQATIN